MNDLHRYAVDENGKTVCIKDVTNKTRYNKFYCKNCGEEMIPVLGKVRDKHFRHKVINPSCSYESYIHKIGKEKIMERFYTQESFLASYYTEYSCSKTNICHFKEKLDNLKCNMRERQTIDLKHLYDTCKDEKYYKGFCADLLLTHSEHPEREPILIEIAFTHDCDKEKVDSGIRIIEIKVNDDMDFSMPFEEQETMFMDFTANNPYAYNAAPPVRFYNFPRQKYFSIPLSRFVVYRTKEGTIEGFVLPQKTNCQDFENEHIHIVDYELVASEEIMEQERRNNIYLLGLTMAIKKGYPVKHCVLCRRHFKGSGGCIIKRIQDYKDEKTGKRNQCAIKVYTSTLNYNQIDKAAISAKCHNFILNKPFVQDILESYKKIPFWDWENKKC